MGTIWEYPEWRGDLAFSVVLPNEVDCLIFSMLSYLDFLSIVPSQQSPDSVPLKTAADALFARSPKPEKSAGVLVPFKEIYRVFRSVRATRRFRSVEMECYVNHVDISSEVQFSATTFLLPGGPAVIAYRGTDDTLVGWKENFNMSFLPQVPAQEEAVAYFASVAERHPNREIILAGHSKGGNLAAYAAICSDPSLRRRLSKVYCYDAPGFRTELIESPAYRLMRPIIKSYVPQSSVVGMLLGHDENYTVVKSRQVGLLQHDSLSWEVRGGSFLCLDKVTAESLHTDRTLNQWIREMSPAQLEQFTDAVYQLLSVDGATTLTGIMSAWNHWIAHSKKLDPKVHKTIQKMIASLVSADVRERITKWGKK